MRNSKYQYQIAACCTYDRPTNFSKLLKKQQKKTTYFQELGQLIEAEQWTNKQPNKSLKMDKHKATQSFYIGVCWQFNAVLFCELCKETSATEMELEAPCRLVEMTHWNW